MDLDGRQPHRQAARLRLRPVAVEAGEDAEAALLAKVKSGIKEAMKAKDSLTSTLLRSIVSEHQYSSKQKGNQVSKVSKLITKAIKRRQDTAKQFRAAKPPREDLAEQEEKEAEVREKLLSEAKRSRTTRYKKLMFVGRELSCQPVIAR